MVRISSWLAVVVAAVGAARADELQAVEDRLTLPAGTGVASAQLAVNLSTDAGLEPVSLSPDVWYGVRDALTVGLVHSERARTGRLSGVGQSLCVVGRSHGCDGVYPGGGAVARVGVMRGEIAVALESGVFVGDVSPLRVAGKVGAMVRWHRGRFGLEAAPAVFLDDVGSAAMHVTMSGAGRRLALALQINALVPFVAADDDMIVGVSVGARYALDARLAIDGAFSMAAVTGGEDVERGWEPRVLTLGVAYGF